MSLDHEMTSPIPITESGIFSLAPAEIRDSNIFLSSSTSLWFVLHSRGAQPRYT